MRNEMAKQVAASDAEDTYPIPADQQKKFNQLWLMSASHPVLRIRYQLDGKARMILACVAHHGYTSNIKDRIAIYVYQRAYRLGYLTKGSHIVVAGVDALSVSFAAIGRYLGHAVSMIVPQKLPADRQYTLRALGAHLITVDCNGYDFFACRESALAIARVDTNTFLPHEHFCDRRVAAHLHHTVPEIYRALAKQRVSPELFTGLSSSGDIYRALRSYSHDNLNKDMPVTPLIMKEIPEQELMLGGLPPSLGTGAKMYQEFHSQPMRAVAYGDAQLLARRLGEEMDFFCGPLSAGNLLGAMEVQTERDSDQQVFTILPDTQRPAFLQMHARAETVRSHYRSPYIKLTGCTTLRRRTH